MSVEPVPDPEPDDIPRRPNIGAVLCIFILLITVVVVLMLLIGYGVLAVL